VKFSCTEVKTRGNFVFLDSSADFSALIPRTQVSQFPQIHSLEGHILSVKGFLETYKGSPQILVFLPLQVEVIE
jgi:DNA/RNA endonuclease YhcR with UshA esterase domain